MVDPEGNGGGAPWVVLIDERGNFDGRIFCSNGEEENMLVGFGVYADEGFSWLPRTQGSCPMKEGALGDWTALRRYLVPELSSSLNPVLS